MSDKQSQATFNSIALKMNQGNHLIIPIQKVVSVKSIRKRKRRRRRKTKTKIKKKRNINTTRFDTFFVKRKTQI